MSDMSPARVAALTGFSRDTIYREIGSGRLPAYRRRGRLRVTVEALDEWRELGKVRPRPVESPMPDPAVPSHGRPPAGRFAATLRSIEGGER